MAESQRSYEIRVVNGRKNLFGDWYHELLRMPWKGLLVFLLLAFLLLNVLFAFAFMLVGGVMHMRPTSFEDAFYFSAQTMGTIGYGAMYPESRGANVLVVVESFVALLTTALFTGLVFTKFSRPTGRVAFSKLATISPMNGKPTLAFRLGNERRNTILEGSIHVALSRNETTEEGMVFYRLVDLKLNRERSPAIARSWTVLHTIDEDSPLFGATPEKAKEEDYELIVSLIGLDDTSYQPVHARCTYEHTEIAWGKRLADVLSEDPDGNITLDLAHFHEVKDTTPTEAFPYPRPDAK
ncbi:MAG TPA: ion channel [Polyangiaceae bacterium]